jgi:alkyl hydroperoxide reductase subunit AhpF
VCDGVFVSIGRKPATEFLKGTVALDPNGYIVADETTKTDIDGVFAEFGIEQLFDYRHRALSPIADRLEKFADFALEDND